VSLCDHANTHTRGILATLRNAARDLEQADQENPEYRPLQRRVRKASKLAKRGHTGQIARMFGHAKDAKTPGAPQLATAQHLYISTDSGPRLDPFAGGAPKYRGARDSGDAARRRRARVATDKHGCVPETEYHRQTIDWAPRVYEYYSDR